MFVAITPPPTAVEDLDEFLTPRRDTWPGRWTAPDQWHLTLAFMPGVADRHLDDLEARLERVATRRTPFEVALTGGGCFPDPAQAKVLFARLTGSGDQLGPLATATRAAATKAGAAPEGGPFTPHVTLARTRRPLEATRWLRVLDTYRGPVWPVRELVLVASHLGEGPRRRPRHEVLSRWPLGERSGAASVHLDETRG